MSKKYYSAPAVEIFDVEAEHMIATSPPGIGGSDGVIDNPDDILTNKRQPSSSPWSNSAPWE